MRNVVSIVDHFYKLSKILPKTSARLNPVIPYNTLRVYCGNHLVL